MGEASAEVPSSREMRSLCRAALPVAVALRPPVDAALRTSALAKSSEFLRVGPLGSTSRPRGSSVGSSSRETARELGWRPAMVVMLDATLSRLSLLASRRGVRGAGEPSCRMRWSEDASCAGEAAPAGISLIEADDDFWCRPRRLPLRLAGWLLGCCLLRRRGARRGRSPRSRRRGACDGASRPRCVPC